MTLRERIQNARDKASRLVGRIPIELLKQLDELVQEVVAARADGFTEAELEEIAFEFRALFFEFRRLRKRGNDAS